MSRRPALHHHQAHLLTVRLIQNWNPPLCSSEGFVSLSVFPLLHSRLLPWLTQVPPPNWIHSLTLTQVWVFGLNPIFPSPLPLQGNKHWWPASALFRMPISLCHSHPLLLPLLPLSPASWISHLLLDFVSFSIKTCSMFSHLHENRISSFALTSQPASVSVLFGWLVSSAECWAASARKWCQTLAWVTHGPQ